MASPVSPATLPELEAERQVIAGSLIKCYACLIGLIPVGIMAVTIESYRFVFIAAASLLILFASFVYYTISGRKEDYVYNFKQKIVRAALMSVHPSLRIEPGSGLSEEEFINSGMFDSEPDRMSSEDQITGKIGKTAFFFSEVHAEKKVSSGKTESWCDIFKGMVFVADFNKSFEGVTIIRPKDTGRALASWFARNVPVLMPGSQNLVQLENINFCREFVTYSSDQVEARYILTPAMMERLCELNSRSEHTLSASFKGRYMFLAFPLDRNYFEPPIFASLLKHNPLQQDIEIVKFMTHVVEDLDLNTRIWGKA